MAQGVRDRGSPGRTQAAEAIAAGCVALCVTGCQAGTLWLSPHYRRLPPATRFLRSNPAGGLGRCAAHPNDHRLSRSVVPPSIGVAVQCVGRAKRGECIGPHHGAGHPSAVRSGLTHALDKLTQTCACHDRHRMAMERCPASGHRCRRARLDSLQARNDTGGRSRLCARSQQRQLSVAMPLTCPTRHPCRQDRGARPACSRCRSRHPHRYPANAWRADPAHDPEWSAACRRAGRSRRST